MPWRGCSIHGGAAEWSRFMHRQAPDRRWPGAVHRQIRRADSCSNCCCRCWRGAVIMIWMRAAATAAARSLRQLRCGAVVARASEPVSAARMVVARIVALLSAALERRPVVGYIGRVSCPDSALKMRAPAHVAGVRCFARCRCYAERRGRF